MGEPVRVVLALAAGLLLGAIHFGGLWLTIRRLPSSRHPALLAFASFVGRTSAVMVGIYVAALVPRPQAGEWSRVALRVAACLAGILVARAIVVRRLRPRGRAPLGSDLD